MADSPSKKSMLRRFRAGAGSAADEVDRQYRSKLQRLAERGMGAKLCRREDPEDVVQSVLHGH